VFASPEFWLRRGRGRIFVVLYRLFGGAHAATLVYDEKNSMNRPRSFYLYS